MSEVPPHPFSTMNPFRERTGAFDMKAGDRCRYTINNRICRVDEFLQDGDAFVTWEDDNSYDTVKWNHLVLA